MCRAALAVPEGSRTAVKPHSVKAVDIAKLVLEYIRALAWPAVVVAVTTAFKTELKALIARIRHADLPGGIPSTFRTGRGREGAGLNLVIYLHGGRVSNLQ